MISTQARTNNRARAPHGRQCVSAAACMAIVAITACEPAGGSVAATPQGPSAAPDDPAFETVRAPDPFSGPDSARMRARVDSVFARFDRPRSPGCAVAVMGAGEIVFGRGYGSADLERGTPLSTASAFDGASMAKQFLTFGIALLANEGKLSLDDPVQRHLPELPDYRATITLRHLVYHTSGLRDWDAKILSGREDLDPAQLTGLSFPPGERHMYDDTGYGLVQQVIERISGQPWAIFARTRIFEPLGMTHSGFPEADPTSCPRVCAPMPPRVADSVSGCRASIKGSRRPRRTSRSGIRISTTPAWGGVSYSR
jgi:CubicO group peptidase (beta-lactamase class C family)